MSTAVWQLPEQHLMRGPVIWMTKGLRAASPVALTSSPTPSAAISLTSALQPCTKMKKEMMIT